MQNMGRAVNKMTAKRNHNANDETVRYPVEQSQEQPNDLEQPSTVNDNAQESIEHDNDNDASIASDENPNRKIQFKKIFQKRKKSSERAREKKIRQNRQLRKAMLPKNALMALNEVKGVVISDFIISSNCDGGFTALVTVNDHQYEGRGPSKMAAKTNACEKALRDYMLSKMVPKLKRVKPEASNNANGAVDSTIEKDDGLDDDLPMINLASFAIFKLYNEWEREGYTVPEMHPGVAHANDLDGIKGAESANKEPKKLPIRTELPANYETMHPATLLCMMRPGISYVDLGCVGDKPNIVQRLGVIVDGQEFSALGRSKKIARRNVAVKVCNELFDTKFEVDESMKYF